jgi:predicted dehydrogenase
MTSQPARVGIAGFGRLAERYYLPAIRSLDGIRLTAITDPLPARRTLATALVPRASVYSHHEAMLEHETLDALLVASPPSTHFHIWNDARTLTLPVFMEKPFVLNNELSQLEDAARDRALLMVNFNRRFWPPYQQLRSVLRSERIGAPTEADFVLHVDLRPWCSVTSHRLAPGEGGVLHDLGSQVLDLVRDVLGQEPLDVLAETWTERWDDDHVRLRLVFASGLTVRCCLAYETRNRETALIRGTRGSVYLNDPNMAVHLMVKAPHVPRWFDRCTDAAVFAYRAIRRDRSMGRYSIRASLAAFLRRLRAKARFSPGFDDAVTNARWLEAASRSIVEGKAVPINTVSGLDRHASE